MSLCGQLIAHVVRMYILRSRVADPSTMTHKQCCACGKLLGNCRERRKRFSEATRHVAPKFIKVLSAHLVSPEERVSQLLAADSFICKKPCFSSLDSLVTLEKKIHEVNEEIVSRLAGSGLYMSAPAASTFDQSDSSLTETSAPATKRHCCGTPSRSNLSCRRLQMRFEQHNHATSPKAIQ